MSSLKVVNVNASSVEDAFEQAELNWIAEQSEMLNIATGKVVENKKVIYRSDNKKQLGVVGINYGIIQNSDCFSFFDIICKQFKAKICRVAEYKGGSIVHLQAEVIDKKFDARVGDEVGFRFNLWNSFDGIHKASVTFSAIRLVCANGLVRNSDDLKNVIEIRHTKNAVYRMEQALKVWNGGELWYNEFRKNVEILNRKMVDRKMVDKFLNDLFGESDSSINKRKKEKVIDLFENGRGNGKNTAWDLLNGVTEYIDWYSKEDREDVFEYSNIGAGYNIKSRAFDLALSL